ncbi:hypothetical protein KTQ42_19530 [Noviherbaspirillum sp. L7-7A]|uniref:hypothetical protein n=1 Tax=Noviherbaspirillum sp. L7-7A TaxID=2850560 RepID=UPI001C2CA8FA|nr:hypothetical protein [Noviherbaspirillum sp. L7-7A]MBV0881482.1 hypothetical protein [Noviherbaspirillum sp. L7-7A]
MISSPNETDYLVVGAGATAMAFVDTLLTENLDATVMIVDRNHRPGGHWNVAYPFVRLHQPAEWYGVASRELGSGTKDKGGPNVGMYRLASGAEVLAYFDQVMRDRFLPSGRVRWLPMSEYTASSDGGHQVMSLTTGKVSEVTVRRKLVDGRHARTEVPATHPPKYAVDNGVHCVSVNQLPFISRPYAAYTVVGSGKTGIDACLWLLEHSVPPERIRWVMPRDAWYFDRANFQPGLENFEHNMGYVANQFDAIAEAESIGHLFDCLEARGALLRFDLGITPSTFRCATMSRGELAQLRRIRNVVRLGRVQTLEPGQMVLDRGTVPADSDTLYVDCSAGAIQMPPKLPVFDDDIINLFMVRTCQPTFSGAVIAYVESHFSDRAQQNAMCAVVPSPELPTDWLRMWLVTLANLGRWNSDLAMQSWLKQCRLNGAAVMMRGVAPDDEARMALIKANGLKGKGAVPKLQALLAGWNDGT